jgi:hypothetical protein
LWQLQYSLPVLAEGLALGRGFHFSCARKLRLEPGG